jgi:hypothetical protein
MTRQMKPMDFSSGKMGKVPRPAIDDGPTRPGGKGRGNMARHGLGRLKASPMKKPRIREADAAGIASIRISSLLPS